MKSEYTVICKKECFEEEDRGYLNEDTSCINHVSVSDDADYTDLADIIYCFANSNNKSYKEVLSLVESFIKSKYEQGILFS